VYQQQQQQQQQLQQEEQQDAENSFLDPPFSRIKMAGRAQRQTDRVACIKSYFKLN
jgi:hypothetical protein